MARGIHRFLREHREEILREWETLVASEHPVVALEGLVLRNSIPKFLGELADWLESGGPPGAASVGAEALSHVLQRLDHGLELAQVLREYRLLRQALLRAVLLAEDAEQLLAGGDGDLAARVMELARLNAGLDVALSDSVGQFVTERDRRVAAERLRAAALSDALGAIDLVIHSSHDLAEVVETALREASAVLGTETAAVSLREDGAWVVRYVHRLPREAIGTRMRDDEEPHAALALREQRPVAVSDAWNDPRVNVQHMRRWNVRAVLVVPLFARGEPSGVMFFNDHRGPRALGAAEVAFGAKFGAALSLAIDNARLFAELKEADRQKTEFLAVLSHELRNPLAPIRNAVALLDRMPPGSAAAQRAKEIIHRQSAQLARLVDDLLDLSRITHGKMHVELAPADARELVRRAHADAQVLFDARRIELALVEPAEPLWILADSARFAQMVGNLLQNALKFTPSGGHVRLEVARRGGACEVSVTDDGQGLRPADLARIFDPFEQATGSRTGAAGGLGLGLALVKRLAAKHHGTVRAQSGGPGRGAEFVLELPLVGPAAVAPEPVAPAARPGTPPLSILVVEDNDDAATTLAELLSLGGHRVTIAGSGNAALDVLATERPDVVICDVGLPDTSGYDVMRQVRARERGRRTFAVALTGYAQPRDREEALTAGFDAHLAKPPPIEELEALLAEAARRRGDAGLPSGPTTKPR